MVFSYVRVSTADQNLERQTAAIREYAAQNGIVIDRMKIEKASGKTFDRPVYQEMKGQLREGDALIIKELDRLGRNMEQIKQEWNSLQEIGVSMIVIDTPMLNTVNKSDLERKLIANIVFELLAYMAEKERQKILARQAEGIAIAKQQGKYKGRKPISRSNFDEVCADWIAEKITGVEAARRLNMSKSTFYRKVKQHQGKG